jgi:hypothetical protein
MFRWPCMVKNSYNKTNQIHQFLKFIFGIKLHVSDSSSVHHQEFFTVHSDPVWHLPLLCVCSEKVLMMDRITKHTHKHTHTHSVWLHWTVITPSQRTLPVRHTIFISETDIHAHEGIRTRDPSKRATADVRLRPHSHRDRPKYFWLQSIFRYLRCRCMQKRKYVFMWILYQTRADKGRLTSETLQVYYAKANRNPVACLEYRLGLPMKILKGLSECVSKLNEIKKRWKRARLEGKYPN